jgi:hypothetical protein
MQMGHMEGELQFNEEGTKWITFLSTLAQDPFYVM